MNRYNKAEDFDIVKELKEKNWDKRVDFGQERKHNMKLMKAKIKNQRF
jgi:hypothetical protein